MAVVGLLGIADDSGSSFQRGCAEAPPLIRQAFYSDSANTWSETGLDLGAADVFVDAGDVVTAAGEDSAPLIEAGVKRLLAQGLKPLCLGGDHAVIYPIVKALAAHNPDLNILHFDAHPDLYDHFEGNRRSHACPFARIMEAGLARRLVQIGIRTCNGHQREQAQRFGVEMVEMKDWEDGRVFRFDGPLYISFDMDCLDPAFAPGISHWEPGGFSTRQALRLIQQVQGTVIGADVVEFNPRVESRMTAMVAAKVMKELMARLLIDHHASR